MPLEIQMVIIPTTIGNYTVIKVQETAAKILLRKVDCIWQLDQCIRK